MILGWFQLLGFVGFFAPSFINLITNFFFWLHCLLGRLQLTDKRAIKHGGLFANPLLAIRLKESRTVELVTSMWWERKFKFPTIRIEGGDRSVEIMLAKVSDATRFEAILLMLKKKGELGLPMYAPLPEEAARQELKDWKP
ncbi:TPA: hypothetical protein DCE37_05805 [Candidatus Latescibacteria bacterium]|nr:hypothetical protein [Candidatus Latescibacterota bacterium]